MASWRGSGEGEGFGFIRGVWSAVAAGGAMVVDFGWEGRKVGEVGEEVVGFAVEVDGGFAFAIGDGEEEAGLAVTVEGDVVGAEACAAAGFLEGRRRRWRGRRVGST